MIKLITFLKFDKLKDYRLQVPEQDWREHWDTEKLEDSIGEIRWLSTDRGEGN